MASGADRKEDEATQFPIDSSSRTIRTPPKNVTRDSLMHKDDKEDVWVEAGSGAKVTDLEKVCENKKSSKERTAEDLCGQCEKTFRNRDLAILCESCSIWHHIKCVNVTKEQYEFFGKSENFPWFCQKCRDEQLLIYGKYLRLEKQVAQLTTENNSFQSGLKNLGGQYEELRKDIVSEIKNELNDSLKEIVSERKFQLGVQREIITAAKEEMDSMICKGNQKQVDEERIREIVTKENNAKSSEWIEQIRNIIAEEMKSSMKATNISENIKHWTKELERNNQEVLENTKKEHRESMIEMRLEFDNKMKKQSEMWESRHYERKISDSELQKVTKTVSEEMRRYMASFNPKQIIEENCRELETEMNKMIVAAKTEFGEIVSQAKNEIGREVINDAVQPSDSEDLQERVVNIMRKEEETKQRAKNLIFFNLEEQQEGNPAERERKDNENITNIIENGIGDQLFRIVKTIRLGKPNEDENNRKARPLLVKLDEVGDKWRILKYSKNLQNCSNWMKEIRVAPDLSLEERQKNRVLAIELKDRKSKGEQNLQIFRGQIIQRGAPAAPQNRREETQRNARGGGHSSFRAGFGR